MVLSIAEVKGSAGVPENAFSLLFFPKNDVHVKIVGTLQLVPISFHPKIPPLRSNQISTSVAHGILFNDAFDFKDVVNHNLGFVKPTSILRVTAIWEMEETHFPGTPPAASSAQNSAAVRFFYFLREPESIHHNRSSFASQLIQQ